MVFIVGGVVVFFVLLFFYCDFLYISFDMEGVESYGGNVRVYFMIFYVFVGVIGVFIV